MSATMTIGTVIGLRSETEETPGVDLGAALAGLARLNGQDVSYLVLKRASGEQLSVGGGPDRFWLQMFDADGAQAWTLLGAPGAEGDTPLMAAGQLCRIPSEEVADLEATRQALSAFLHDGSRAAALTWRPDW